MDARRPVSPHLIYGLKLAHATQTAHGPPLPRLTAEHVGALGRLRSTPFSRYGVPAEDEECHYVIAEALALCLPAGADACIADLLGRVRDASGVNVRRAAFAHTRGST